MSTEEHLQLSTIIKKWHQSLRMASKKHGHENAWREHIKNQKGLSEYANAMKKLAMIWEHNSTKDNSLVISRIKWTVDYCLSYFFTDDIYLTKRAREKHLLESFPEILDTKCNILDVIPITLRVLDVGSCFNPFKNTPFFDVTAIDLYPASDDVLRGDFLSIDVEPNLDDVLSDNNEVKHLPANYYNCIIFSLLLEYIPSPEQRLVCCRKAYNLLQPEGILIIVTPDSEHVGKNASLMKNWRYVLAKIGFLRVRFEKLTHITCMAYRKAINRSMTLHWAEKYRRYCIGNISEVIQIPQDENQI